MNKRDFRYISVNGVKRPYVQDEVLLGKWEAVSDIPASKITKRDTDTEVLNGLLYYGYEMKWDTLNTNGEVYEKGCLDGFIKSYFVEKGLNMPVTLEHSYSPADIVGRVLYIEVNSVGFYFVCYVPATCPEYSRVKWLTEQGLVQGFSKEGYVTDGEWKQNAAGEWSFVIREIMVCRVSLVCTPANGLRFEQVKETKNSLAFVNTIEEDKEAASCLRRIINKKL